MFLISLMIMGCTFSCRLKKRDPYIKLQIIYGGALFLLACIMQMLLRISRGTISIAFTPSIEILSTIIVCVTLLFLIAFWIYKTRQASFTEAFYISTISYLAQHVAYCAQNLLFKYVMYIRNDIFKEIVSMLILILLAFIFFFIFVRSMVHDNHYISNVKETLPLLVVIIIIVMFFSAIASIHNFIPIHSIYGMVFCLFILSSQMERQKTLVEESEAKIREQLLVTQQAQYKIYKENADLLNVKSHDLKHQIAALRYMYDDKHGEEVINSIASTVRIYDSFVRSGNEGLDTILTGKNQVCIEKNILFTCMVNGKLLSFMSQVDLYSLFGNLMDNAIEAVEALPEENRSISLYVKESMGVVMITEENPCGEVFMKNGKLQTTKIDKENHGYGLKSMDMVAQKYNGTLSTQVKDNIFSLCILLQMENNN